MRSLGRELSMEAIVEREQEEEDEGGQHKWTEFCTEFAWSNIWFQGKEEKVFRGWTDIGENFLLGLFFGLLSLFDVGSDSWSAWRFWFGDDYTKTVSSEDDPYVTGNFTNCTKVGYYYDYSTADISSFTFECREKNKVCAGFTIFFMVLPSINLSLALASRGSWWLPMAITVAILPFPLTLLLVKLVATVNVGKQFKAVNLMVTKAEARWESSLQFCLQLFIVFTRGDRQPSDIQLFSIGMSVIMMSKGSIGNFLADEQPLPLGQEIIRIGTMFPLHVTNLIFKLGSLSIICALLCFNAIWIYLGAWLFWLTLWFSGRTRHLTKSAAGHVIGLPNTTTPDFNFAACRQRRLKEQESKSNLMFWNVAWLLINGVILICCAVTANLRPKSAIPTFFPFDDNHLGDIFPNQVNHLAYFRGISTDGPNLSLTDLPIVKNIAILNCGVIIILTCGLVSLLLIHLQLVKEYSSSSGDPRDDLEGKSCSCQMSKRSCIQGDITLQVDA